MHLVAVEVANNKNSEYQVMAPLINFHWVSALCQAPC